MRCPECDAVNPPDAPRCQACGHKLRRPSPPAADQDAKAKPSESVQARPRRRRRRRDYDDAEGLAATIVPYKNPAALISYYLGYIGLVVGFGALVWMLLLFTNAERGRGADAQTVDSMELVVKVGLGLGAVLGLAGCGLGIFGLHYGRSHRRARGQAHATTGIVLGAVNSIGQVVGLLLILRYMNSHFH